MTIKAKLTSGLAAIFAAGLVVGGTAGYATAKANAPKPAPQKEESKRSHRSFSDKLCSRLEKDLDLTPEQVALVKPITEQTAAQIKAVNAENSERVRAIFKASHEKIKPILTPEQLGKFEEKNRERDMRFRKETSGKPPC